MLVLNTDTSINNLNYLRFMEQQEELNKNDDGEPKKIFESDYTRKTQNQ